MARALRPIRDSAKRPERGRKRMLTRRDFLGSAAVGAALAAGGPMRRAQAARETELNILCWEGYNSAQVLDPFRSMKTANVRAESLTNDATMINRLRAGET